MRRRIDRLFETYCRSGDPRALGEVFDGSARELYRLACHLVGDRHAAEDLVQQTFVAAIEHRISFESGRRVLPWLCGILTHRALELHRRQRRGEPMRPRDDVVDPRDEATRRELEAKVAASVRELPAPYRQPLLLHLVHGLGAKEIAEVLGLPDATVRTQLARGLERLRRRLPAGIGAATFAAVPAPLGLPAVRAAVLHHADAAAAAGALGSATTTALVTGYAMKKILLACIALLVLVSTWAWWDRSPSSSAKPSTVARHVEPATSSREPSLTTRANDEPERVDANPSVATAECALEVVVSWHDGGPAADVPVRCQPHDAESWVEPWQRVARTDADGIAAFTGLEPGQTLSLQTGRCRSQEVTLARGANCVEITIDAGVDLRGRVVTTDQRPVAGATVWMSMWPNSDDGEPVATSGADGAFVIRSAATGHSLTATAPGLGSAMSLDVPVSAPSEPIELLVRDAPGTIVGSVFDASGRAVAGARVLVGVTLASGGEHRSLVGQILGQDFWPSRFARTDADGTFRVEGLPPLPWPVWVGAAGHAPSRQIVQLQEHVATYATFHLSEGATIHGLVRGADGAPVEGARISTHHPFEDVDAPIGLGIRQLQGPPLFAKSEAFSDAEGRYELVHVMPGDVWINAWREGRGARLHATLTEGERRLWDTTLEPSGGGLTLHGTLTDGRGAPLDKWTVQFDHEDESRGVHTDEQGSFRMTRVEDVGYRLTATPRHPGIAAPIELGTFRPSASPVHLVVPDDDLPTGAIRGRVLDPDGAPCVCYVSLRDETHDRSAQVRSEPDGTFSFTPIAAGSYSVSVESRSFGGLRVGTFDVSHGLPLDVGSFCVPAPGSLRVALVDERGDRVPGGWVTVHAVGDPAGRVGSLRHKEGIVTGNLQPGHWFVATKHPLPLCALPFTIVAGRPTELRLVIPDGMPFVLRAPAHPLGRSGLRQIWRDENARVLRDWHVPSDMRELQMRAPLGTYTIEVLDRDGRSATTTFTLDGVGTPVVMLPLPK